MKSTKKLIYIGMCFSLLLMSCQKTKNQTASSLPSVSTSNNVTETKQSNADFQALTDDLNAILNTLFTEDEKPFVSVSLFIPSKSYSFNFQSDLNLPNASTVKVPLNMYIYDLAKQNPSILKMTIPYYEIYYEEGAGIMQDTEIGTTFDIQTLLHYSIQYSDNIAANMLFQYFIYDISTATELIPYYGEADYANWTSNAFNKMQALTYLYQHLNDYQTLIKDMKLSVYRDRLPSLLPSYVEVALKTGDWESTIHDYGIVFDQQNVDYLIVLSLDGIVDGGEKMAFLSLEIYEAIQDHITK